MNRTALALVLPTLLFLQCSEPLKEQKKQRPNISGHQQMIGILDSIARFADPSVCYHLNSKKAEAVKKQMVGLPPEQMVFAKFKYAEQLLNAGKTEAAIVELTQVVEHVGDVITLQNKLVFEYLALAYMRLGEQANCIDSHNAESCIVPIKGGGVYRDKIGLDNAIAIYKRILKKHPDDLQSQWLLNIAYMNAGQYPSGVPTEYRIPKRFFKNTNEMGGFKDVAIPLGLDERGVSGSVCMDDFNGDGFLDIFTTSYGLADPVSFFINNGDGTFSDKTKEANLDGIVSGLNVIHADYDNDGDPDILMLRGGWLEGGTHPNSLLRNNGNGTFTDVTIEAGLLSFHPTQAAAWADYDGDGWLDLYVANESLFGERTHPNELYRNRGDGTFTNVAPQLNVALKGGYKGAAWGDVNNDRFPDLYLSNLSGDNVLLVNQANGAFNDVSLTAQVVSPKASFPTWFFDFNHDGFDDIIVAGYNVDLKQDAASVLLREYLDKTSTGDWFRLYENKGDGTFDDVTEQAGLQKNTFAMGCNFGDLDNDGWVDFYLGTGKPDLRSLVPNRMFKNIGGERFEEISMNGFAHLQKGHGIAFGDLDNDGDQDIYEVMGGAFEGDLSNNILFKNPGHKSNHWIVVELEGVTCNRDAIGSKIAVFVKDKNGEKRTIYSTVNTGGSFGSASMQQEMGLGKAVGIEKIEVYWAQPGPAKTIYENVPMDAFIKIKEGAENIEILERKKIEKMGV